MVAYIACYESRPRTFCNCLWRFEDQDFNELRWHITGHLGLNGQYIYILNYYLSHWKIALHIWILSKLILYIILQSTLWSKCIYLELWSLSCILVKMAVILYCTFKIKFMLCVVFSAVRVVYLQSSFVICFPISLKCLILALHRPENPHNLVCVIALLSPHCCVHRRSILLRLQR